MKPFSNLHDDLETRQLHSKEAERKGRIQTPSLESLLPMLDSESSGSSHSRNSRRRFISIQATSDSGRPKRAKVEQPKSPSSSRDASLPIGEKDSEENPSIPGQVTTPEGERPVAESSV